MISLNSGSPSPEGFVDASGARTSACTSRFGSLRCRSCCRFCQAHLSCDGLARFGFTAAEGCGAGTEVPAPLRFQTKVVSRVLQCGLGGVTRPPGTTGEWSRPSPPQSRDETICQPVVEQGVCQYPEKPGNLLQNQHFTGFREESLRDHCRKMLPRISYQQGVPFRAKPQSSQEKHPEESRPERPQQTHYFHHAVRHQAGSRGNGRCRRPDRTGKCRVDHRSITEEGRDT